MDPNHSIEKNKIREKVKMINSAFYLVWMVRSLLFLYGLPCSVQVVPDSEVFQRECMISPNMLCSVFNQTPPSLAPEELHFRTYLNKSPEEVEEEIDACMSEVYKIDDLRTSHVYTAFCRLIFENTEIRKTFDCLPNEKLKCEYVLKKFNEMDGTL